MMEKNKNLQTPVCPIKGKIVVMQGSAVQTKPKGNLVSILKFLLIIIEFSFSSCIKNPNI